MITKLACSAVKSPRMNNAESRVFLKSGFTACYLAKRIRSGKCFAQVFEYVRVQNENSDLENRVVALLIESPQRSIGQLKKLNR